jgi:hypothetical protein
MAGGIRVRVAFAIDLIGQSAEIGEMLQLAIASCLKNTRLQPVVLAPTFHTEFRTWLDKHGVSCVEVETPLVTAIKKANRDTGYPLQAAGNYLRYEACSVFDDEMILYADCDVIFLRDVVIPEKPNLLAAGPEDSVDDFRRINSGVMLLNREAVGALLPGFYAFAAENLQRFYPGFDQPAVNEYFSGRIEELPLALNWRPYWGASDSAAIVHFHGFKPGLAEMLLNGIYPGPPERRELITTIMQRSLVNIGFFLHRLRDPSFHELAYFGKLTKLAELVGALQRRPLEVYCAAMLNLRETLENRAHEERQQIIAFAGRLLGGDGLRRADLDVGEAQNVRLVFAGTAACLGLSDVLDVSGGNVAGSLRGATTGNIRIRNGIDIGGTVVSPIDVVDEAKPVDVIYHLASLHNASSRMVRLTVFALEDLRIKVYLSESEQFSERRAFWVVANSSASRQSREQLSPGSHT